MAKDPWRIVTRAGFYRLKTADAEQQNAPIEVGIDEDRYWRARITNGARPPQKLLRLHVEWIPNEVTFLAQGSGPFLLACAGRIDSACRQTRRLSLDARGSVECTALGRDSSGMDGVPPRQRAGHGEHLAARRYLRAARVVRKPSAV
jgi:hypothetical protein